MQSHTPRLSTRTSLYAGYASLLAFMLLIAAISLYALANSNKDFFLYVNGVEASSRLANTLNDAAAQRAIALRNIALNSNVTARGQQRGAIAANEKMVASSLAALRQAIDKHDDVSPKARELFSTIEQVESRYKPVAHTIAEHLFKGENDEALRMVSEQCTPLLAELTQAIGEYLRYTNQRADLQVSENDANYLSQRNLLLAITALAVLLAAVLGYVISRNLLRALGAEPSELNQLAQRVAQGDLRASERKIEPPQASIMAALLSMQENLRNMTKGINLSSQTVAESSQELSQSAFFPTHLSLIRIGLWP
jgi:methyl-accepting chemotaxis protein